MPVRKGEILIEKDTFQDNTFFFVIKGKIRIIHDVHSDIDIE